MMLHMKTDFIENFNDPPNVHVKSSLANYSLFFFYFGIKV